MSADALAQFLVATGGAGVLAAIVTAWVTRKKIGAEAVSLLTKAQSETLLNIRQDNLDLRARVTELERRDQEHERREASWDDERREWRAALRLHAMFDYAMLDRLRDLGVRDLPDPPPLIPPPKL